MISSSFNDKVMPSGSGYPRRKNDGIASAHVTLKVSQKAASLERSLIGQHVSYAQVFFRKRRVAVHGFQKNELCPSMLLQTRSGNATTVAITFFIR